MGLFSDIISAVGNGWNDIFGGGNSGSDNNNQKKKQNTPAPTPAPSSPTVNLPSILRAPGTGAQNTQVARPQTPVFNMKPVDTSNITNNPNATQPQPAPQQTPIPSPLQQTMNRIQQENSAPPQHASLWHDLTHNPVTNVVGTAAKDVGGAAAGTSLGVLRAGEGAVQALGDTPNMLEHLGTWGLNKAGILSNSARTTANEATNNATNDVLSPVNWLAQKTDQASNAYGSVAHDFYKPAQIAANVATVVPGVAALAAKGAQLAGDAGKAGDVINAIHDFTKAQSAAPALARIPGTVSNVVTPLDEAGSLNRAGAAGEAEEAASAAAAPSEPTVTESGIKTPEEQPVNSPSNETSTPRPTTQPGAPESGIKPVTPPPAPPELGTVEPTPGVSEPATTPALVEAAPTPAPVQTAKDAAQAAVDKAAETPVATTPPPATAAVPEAPAEAASVAAAANPAEQATVDEAANLNSGVVNKDLQHQLATKTDDPAHDTQNATELVNHLLNNTRDFAPEEGAKNPLQRVLDIANGHLHSNDIVSSILNKRLGTHLSDTEVNNVIDAIETKNPVNLTGKESEVYNAIKQNIESPSNTTRASLDSDYQAAENHFPQVRQTSVRDAAQGASQAKGVNSKISTFNDLLNQNSRFSQGSTLGKFTDASGKTIVGDGDRLGLLPKQDGTFVDKNGKVYNYSRATTRELKDAGVKLQSGKDALAAYTKDTLNLKTRADAQDYLVKNADSLGLSNAEMAGKSTPVTLKSSDGESHTLYTDSKTASAIEKSGIINSASKDASLPVKAWNAVTNALMQSTVMNPTVHGLNLATNAFIRGGAGALGHSLKPIDEAAALRMSDAGVHFPTYGKNSASMLAKVTKGVSKVNERAISAIDAHVRAGMFEKLTNGENAMPDKQAAKVINDWMGDRGTYASGNKTAQMGMFWRYFARQNVNAGRIINDAVHGNVGPLVNAAVAGAATYGADKGLQAATGNKGSYIHPPGVVGIVSDYLKSANALAHGQFRNSVNPVVNHINPLASQVAEQVLGVNNYGDKLKTTGARVSNILGMSPVTNLVNNNGHSAAEKGLNTFGVYTPHIKGDMATSPNGPLSFLNVNGARNGSTIAFPKDFTGEQSSKAYDNLLNAEGSKGKFSTAGQAQFNAQSQSAQQAQIKAAGDLKQVGITNLGQVHDYSQLSPSDQKAYTQAATQVTSQFKSPTAKNIQEQLITNGNKQLAGKLNTGAPGATYSAQEAVDKANFIKSGQNSQSIDGFHFEKTSNPNSPNVMQQKDYDYKNADQAMTDAKSLKDVGGFVKGSRDLAGNISWQLQHATLTDSQRNALVDKAVKANQEAIKYNNWGQFTKPKGAPSYDMTFDTRDNPKASGYIKAIQQSGAKYGVDVNALLAVAAQEGLNGGVGDNGTSFGPFQLHEGGALPPGKDQAWAESPAGIDYAVQTIKGIVGNKTGADAINAIASQFEKSTDPQGEAAKALALYEGGKVTLAPGGTTISSGSSSGSTSPAAAFRALGIPSSGNSVLMPKAATGLTAGADSYKTPTLASFQASTSVNGNPFARKITAVKGVK